MWGDGNWLALVHQCLIIGSSSCRPELLRSAVTKSSEARNLAVFFDADLTHAPSYGRHCVMLLRSSTSCAVAVGTSLFPCSSRCWRHWLWRSLTTATLFQFGLPVVQICRLQSIQLPLGCSSNCAARSISATHWFVYMGCRFKTADFFVYRSLHGLLPLYPVNVVPLPTISGRSALRLATPHHIRVLRVASCPPPFQLRVPLNWTNLSFDVTTSSRCSVFRSCLKTVIFFPGAGV